MQRVKCESGATMTVPTNEDRWQARYEPTSLNMLSVASAMDSYAYLLFECTREEAWRRIKNIRSAMGSD